MEQVIPQSVTRVPDLVERPDGLWEYRGESFDEHVDVFTNIAGKVESAKWAMGAICASVEKKYGEGKVEEFASKVGYSPRHVRRMARTYKEAIEKGRYRPFLSFTHHTEALAHPDPDEALDVAESGDMSALGLRDWIDEQARERFSKARPKPKIKTRNTQYLEFLERVDQTIIEDFMATCPNAEWGRRVFKGWRDDIAWEMTQVSRSEAAARINDAIDAGALTIPDIKNATGLPMKEIEGVIAVKVAEGKWEWVREGGETDVARGTRRSILHRVGTPVFT